MKVRLDNSDTNLSYVGECTELPETSRLFEMNLTDGGVLYTGPVLSYEVHFPDRSVTFKTQNSTYELTLLEY